MQELKWKYFAWTYVEYPEGDMFGYALAVSSLLPIALCVSFVTLILSRRDLHTMCFFAGQLANELLNRIIKNIIREPRPIARDGLTSEFGMPSSHAQFMTFFCVYFVIYLLIRVPASKNLFALISHMLYSIATLVATVFVLFSRIYLGYHTPTQVIVGAAVGIVFGIVWLVLVQVVLTPLFPRIASLSIAQFFLIRDTSKIPNVMQFEYNCIRSEIQRQSKANSNGSKKLK